MIKICDTTQPKEVYRAIKLVLDSGQFVKGPIVEEFEEKWADICGMKYGIAVGSGAQALELAIEAIFPQDVCISYPNFTFNAVPNAIERMGRTVSTLPPYNIYTHHLHDQKPDYIPDLEDCSHCHGYQPVSETAIFSLFPAKILGACGEAGIIVTNNKNVNDFCKDKRSHGICGTNARMDEIQAASLIVKLPYLQQWIDRRLEIVRQYDLAFGRNTPGTYHYAYAFPGNQEKMEKLIKAGIESKFYYDKNYMAIPLHPFLTDEEVKFVIKEVNKL